MHSATALHPAARLFGAGPARDIDASDPGPHPFRPILYAYPVMLLLSFGAWTAHLPPDLHISLLGWLILCMAGATEPLFAFTLAVRLSAKYPLFARPSRSLAIHAVAIAVSVALEFLMRALVASRAPIPVDPTSKLAVAMPTLVVYVFIALAAQGVRAARNAKHAEAARERLRLQLERARAEQAEAELRALKAELNPHFLGNALQGVKPLLRTDTAAAGRVLSQLGDLLRSTLQRAGTQETTLREELDALRPFLDVERERLAGRLDTQIEIDPAVAEARVPDMLLQPLVENAVKHGLMPIGGGRVRVSARPIAKSDDRFEIVVEDDGVSLGTVGTTRSSDRGGVGLGNVRARLRELYGDAASLELSRGGIGTMVRVTLPLLDDDVEPRAAASAPATTGSTRAEWAWRNWPVYAGAAWRIALSVGCWFYWTRNNVTRNALYAALRDFNGKELYSIVDGALMGALMLAMTHGAFWAARNFPFFRKDSTLRSALKAVGMNAAVLLASVIAINGSKYLLVIAFDYRFLIRPERLVSNMLLSAFGASVLYTLAAAVAQFYYPMRAMIDARVKRHQLNVDLAITDRRRTEAELRALKAELNPHFIGNALTAVSVLMHTDVPAATRVLDQLTDLLRLAIDGVGTPEVTLREELAALEPFLDVERLRLGGGLTVNVEIDDRVLNGKVPHLILQPLVENAVKHGFADRGTGGRIDVSARRANSWLELSVRDDGTGLGDSGPRLGATGLANTRARLTQLYGDDASLELASGGNGGTVATIKIPWNEGAGAAHLRA